MKAPSKPDDILDRIANELRVEFCARAAELAAIAGPAPRQRNRPAVVREVEEIIQTQGFGCYTDRVAQLCSKLLGHKIDHKPDPPQPWPPAAFLVVESNTESALAGHLTNGETVMVVGGLRGFGSNIFSAYTGMRTDGSVGGHLTTATARPATEREIRAFLRKASARAMVVLAELLEEKGK